jgi:hypothetical protein
MILKFTKTLTITFFASVLFNTNGFAQIPKVLQAVNGNFQIDAANYQKDTAIKADPGTQVFRYNAFGNINYTIGDFSAGFRYESYNPPLIGFLPGYNGSGIPYRYARYKHKDIDITVGNFYEQFGSGLTLRSYEDRGLLYDNALDGIRVIFSPKNGIRFKGLVGKQRTYFSLSPGVVRGFDAEINVTELFDSIFKNSKTKVIFGGSFVSKYQAANDPTLVLPENVGNMAGRLTIIRGGFNFNTEYAYKINDPSYQNHFSYKSGRALIATTSYATKGFSILLTGKMIDNMSFRSDRNATNTIDMINYQPSLTKPHTYMMAAYYPYASQANGEVGGMGEIQYKVKKGSWLGGKYGMDISLNGSVFYGLDTVGTGIADSARHLNYTTNYGNVGNEYFHDINIEINKKFSKKLKMTFMYANQFLNQSVVQFNTLDKEEHPDVRSNIGVIDITYRYKTGSAIRFETQGFFGKYEYKNAQFDPKGDKNITNNTGSWITELIEWTPTTNWFLIVADQYNYNNPTPNKQLHYYYGSIGYVNGPTRISISYGRQRQGIFCAGGVCRFVPAASGFNISISSSF